MRAVHFLRIARTTGRALTLRRTLQRPLDICRSLYDALQAQQSSLIDLLVDVGGLHHEEMHPKMEEDGVSSKVLIDTSYGHAVTRVLASLCNGSGIKTHGSEWQKSTNSFWQ